MARTRVLLFDEAVEEQRPRANRDLDALRDRLDREERATEVRRSAFRERIARRVPWDVSIAVLCGGGALMAVVAAASLHSLLLIGVAVVLSAACLVDGVRRYREGSKG